MAQGPAGSQKMPIIQFHTMKQNAYHTISYTNK